MNPSLPSTIPEAIRRKVTAMDPTTQAAFLSEFSRRRKSVIVAYLLLGGGLHYAYVGKVWLTLLFICTCGGFIVWWLIDLLRVPGMVNSYNNTVALNILRDIQVLA